MFETNPVIGGAILTILLAGSVLQAYAQTTDQAIVDDTQALAAELSAEQAGPYPADPDGEGSVRITISIQQQQLCYELQVSGIQPASEAHLHLGQPQRLGPIRLELSPPSDGASRGCVPADRNLLLALRDNPAAFYVDVHNAEYAVALRGQLGR